MSESQQAATHDDLLDGLADILANWLKAHGKSKAEPKGDESSQRRPGVRAQIDRPN